MKTAEMYGELLLQEELEKIVYEKGVAHKEELCLHCFLDVVRNVTKNLFFSPNFSYLHNL